MRVYFLFMLLLCISSCGTDDNPLVGRWQFDGDRTLKELRASEGVPMKVTSCYENKVCGYDLVLTFTKETWTQHFTFSPEVVSEPVEYEINLLEGNVYQISSTADGQPDKYSMYFIRPDLAYSVIEIDGFKWKEYVVKMP